MQVEKLNDVVTFLRERTFFPFTSQQYDAAKDKLDELVEFRMDCCRPESFCAENITFNDAVSSHVAKQLNQRQMFLLACEGMKSGLTQEDEKTNVWICKLVHNNKRKFVRIMKYFEYKQIVGIA